MILVKQLKLLFRDRVAILASILLPLVLTYLFSFSNGQTVQKLYIADNDESTISSKLIELLDDDEKLKVVTCNETELKQKIYNDDIDFGFIINKDFSKNLLEDKIDANFVQNYQSNNSIILQESINEKITNMRKIISDTKKVNIDLKDNDDKLTMKIVDGVKNINNISVVDNTKQQNNVSGKLLIGFLSMFLWFVVIQGCRTFLDEKENGTFDRLKTVPYKYNKFIANKLVVVFIFAVIHVLVILLCGQYFFKTNILENILPTLVIFAAYLYLLIGITMLFVPFMKTHQQFTAIISSIMVLTGILGGAFFPIDIAPRFMKVVSRFTPEGWAIPSLTEVMFNNGNIQSQAMSVVVFLVAGSICLGIAGLIYDRKIKKC